MHEFQREGVTTVVVSHSTELVATFCERAIWLEHGRIVMQGPATDVAAQYAERVHQSAELMA